MWRQMSPSYEFEHHTLAGILLLFFLAPKLSIISSDDGNRKIGQKIEETSFSLKHELVSSIVTHESLQQAICLRSLCTLLAQGRFITTTCTRRTASKHKL